MQTNQIPIQYPQSQQGNLAYLPTAYPPSNPYWNQPPQQQPQDPIDQIAKVAKLLDFLQNKQGQASPSQAQPLGQEQVSQFGTTGIANTAQFQAQGQANLDRQYQQETMPYLQNSGMRMASPQQRVESWQNNWLNTSPSNNLEAALVQKNQLLANAINSQGVELEAAYKLIGDLVHFMEVNVLLNQEIEALDMLVAQMMPFITAAQVWAQDAIAHEQALGSVCDLLNNPGFLAYWAFERWNQAELTEFDVGLLADQFLKLSNKYKLVEPATPSQQMYQQVYQQPQAYQPQIPMPVPGNNASNQPQGIYAVLEMMKHPKGADTAKTLQRMRMQGVI